MLASLAVGHAISATIDIPFGTVPLTISAMRDAAAVVSANVSRRAVVEAAVYATGTVRVDPVDEAIAVIVVTVVADFDCADDTRRNGTGHAQDERCDATGDEVHRW